MSRSRVFFDSNVPLYLLSEDLAKAEKAEALLAQGGVISVQVLNESARVLSRKRLLGWDEIDEFLRTLRVVCEVRPLTVDIHENALALARRHGFAFFDALIVACALEAGCDTLYSEDFQHGMRVADRLSILNPFLPAL
ncbi:PIN domain-containing protein [Nevskia sp.]|uniref:PIN domain-containing protein n=1 Tax=Nevskia sp. TaxID=1929292 RepID=UPI0025D2B6EE|nr:PIN domain-containing protein [Nevskia sp.]